MHFNYLLSISGGSRIFHWGGANLRRVHFSAKTKEMNPVGGGGAGGAPWIGQCLFESCPQIVSSVESGLFEFKTVPGI